jgi:hypothetical protein
MAESSATAAVFQLPLVSVAACHRLCVDTVARTEILRRAVRKAGVPVLALVVVGVALTGGAVSGWIEHGPVISSGTAVTAAPESPSSSTSTSATVPGGVEGLVKQQIVEDLGLDLSSQGLDPDLRHRRQLAMAPAAVAQRRSLIQQAWAPDQVARIEADYDQIVVAHASNPTVPSVTDATFEVTAWQSVTISGTSARGVVVGHFRLHEPGNVAARANGGYVVVFDRTWTVAATLSAGRWKMEGRTFS